MYKYLIFYIENIYQILFTCDWSPHRSSFLSPNIPKSLRPITGRKLYLDKRMFILSLQTLILKPIRMVLVPIPSRLNNGLRITSYNVCYTKLLREKIHSLPLVEQAIYPTISHSELFQIYLVLPLIRDAFFPPTLVDLCPL